METTTTDTYIAGTSTVDVNQDKCLFKESELKAQSLGNKSDKLPGARVGRKSHWITVGDFAISLFAVFPGLCLYWRGSWDLISSIVFPGQEPLCSWTCSAVGALMAVDFFILPPLRRCIPMENKCAYVVFTRLFMIYHAFLYMFLWRGVWGVADHYITRNWAWSLVALASTLALMALLRILRQTVWPPFNVAADRGDLMAVVNRFGTKPQNPCWYFLDSIFTALLANILAIFAWRTIWCVWDGLIYPNNSWWSDMTSFIAGLAGTLVLFALQRVFTSISMFFERRDYFIFRLMWEGFVYVIVFISMTSLWRGCWNFNIRYLITEPRMGGIVNHICGTVALLVLNVYSLVGSCGCAVDGSETDGGAFFPVQYINVFCAKPDEVIDEKTKSVTIESYISCENQDGRKSTLSHRIYDGPMEEEEVPVKGTGWIRRRSYNKNGHITNEETESLKPNANIAQMDEHTDEDRHNRVHYMTRHEHPDNGIHNTTQHEHTETAKYSGKEIHKMEPELENAVQENHTEPDSHIQTPYRAEIGNGSLVVIHIANGSLENPECSPGKGTTEDSSILTH